MLAPCGKFHPNVEDILYFCISMNANLKYRLYKKKCLGEKKHDLDSGLAGVKTVKTGWFLKKLRVKKRCLECRMGDTKYLFFNFFGVPRGAFAYE